MTCLFLLCAFFCFCRIWISVYWSVCHTENNNFAILIAFMVYWYNTAQVSAEQWIILSSNYFYRWGCFSWKMSIVRILTNTYCPCRHLYSPHSVCALVSTSKSILVWSGLPGDGGPAPWISALHVCHLSHICKWKIAKCILDHFYFRLFIKDLISEMQRCINKQSQYTVAVLAQRNTSLQREVPFIFLHWSLTFKCYLEYNSKSTPLR